ncbi:hypothetical protein J6TS1_35710 [Siminovitchia terrae]|uniref:Uncharacterized protein n=1 Tax=Siminovitchia terrae TaxID=1914933 RepID=A0ABQ4L0I3_SIMTE|nr:hypothetical protein J22TS1_19660 [Siminovitchia terrae]GIN97701.1 hypothetical protein J6TS1_35710 [Siminovitchia terrae]
MINGDTSTYPQLRRVIEFCFPNQVVDLAEKIIIHQYAKERVKQEHFGEFVIRAG